MVESVHLVVFHWVLNDLFARVNQVGRYDDGKQKIKTAVFEGN
jgi:D-sedoheptulose 7-phosphate isomerase